jgi:LEA14-like dessication related protein
MTVPRRSLIAALLLVLPLTACAGYRQPEIRLEGISVGSIGLRGGLLYAQLHVTNPNRFDLETSALTYDLQLAHPTQSGEWISFAQGTMDEEVRVRRNGEAVIQIPIQFRYEDMGGALRSILDTGTFNYRVEGDVRLKEPMTRTIPYRKTGIVTLAGAR